MPKPIADQQLLPKVQNAEQQPKVTTTEGGVDSEATAVESEATEREAVGGETESRSSVAEELSRLNLIGGVSSEGAAADVFTAEGDL